VAAGLEVSAITDAVFTGACLGLTVRGPEFLERTAALEELSWLRLSGGNGCEKELLAWQRSYRSIIRRDPK
jgi:hypothetical protein